jgi:hypothetical protein
MPPKAKWREALQPYLREFDYRQIVTGEHEIGDGGARYVYTGNAVDSSPEKPMVYCHHPQYFATPPRTIILRTDGKVIVIRGR